MRRRRIERWSGGITFNAHRVPRLAVYRIATDIAPRWRIGRNTYDEARTIGVAADLGYWCVSLLWRRA